MSAGTEVATDGNTAGLASHIDMGDAAMDMGDTAVDVPLEKERQSMGLVLTVVAHAEPEPEAEAESMAWEQPEC